MTTIESHIALHAARQPDRLAIVCGQDRCSYADLNARIEARTAARPPLPATLRATPDIDFIASYFALHRLGTVAAPLEHDMPEDTLRRIGAQLAASNCPQGTADVLYTTGTTGLSKGVMVSHRAIMANAENLIAAQQFTHDTVFVVNGPLNHIGSLSKVHPVMLLGATLIITDGLKDLNTFFAAFTDMLPHSEEQAPRRRYATFLVPASIRILLQMAPHRLAALADRLDFIETGAAAMAQADMETLCRLLPHTRLYNTYASTETGIISTHNFNPQPNGQNACLPSARPRHADPDPRLLGRPMPHSGFFITEDGLIACTGDTLMTGYLGDDEHTEKVMRHGALYTSDLGTIDNEGQLHLLGRRDDVINIGGFKVAPTEVENAAMSHASVADCLCTAVDHRITGKALKLLVVVQEGNTLDKHALARHLRERLETFKVPMLYEQVENIKRTFNGKPDRKAYLPSATP